MRRCVVVGGADIGRYDRIHAYLRTDDFYICCDSGLKHREGLEIVSNFPVQITDQYAFFSLLNISGTAQGITIRNAKYTLEDAEITCEYQYGISNEVLPGRVAEVSVKRGRLLLIKVLP